MEYGKLQGEIVAAGVYTGATPAVLSTGFNVASVLRTGAGLVSVTLSNGIDQSVCAIVANATTAPNTVSVNNAGADTDTVKNFAAVNAAGAAVDVGVSFVIVRTASP